EAQARLEKEDPEDAAADGVPRLTPLQEVRRNLRKDLLEVAAAGIERVARSAENSTAIDNSMAVTRQRMGDLFVLTERKEQALQQYEHCRTIAEKLLGGDRDNVQAKRHLALVHNKLGKFCWDRVDDPTSPVWRDPAEMRKYRDHCRKSVELFEALAARRP